MYSGIILHHPKALAMPGGTNAVAAAAGGGAGGGATMTCASCHLLLTATRDRSTTDCTCAPAKHYSLLLKMLAGVKLACTEKYSITLLPS